MNDIISLSASQLAASIREREISPLDAFDAYATQLESVNPALNAVVVERLEDARKEAIAKTEQKPIGQFFGVPITIKEMISVEGLPSTAGSKQRAEAVAFKDAAVVQRLRENGAIVLGLTNQSELGLWIESKNPIYGRTNNPYDLSRTCGGSSGGEAAIVSAGGSAFGIGSDMGGSIRIPGAWCGVWGHKPSGGLVPVSGHFPLDYSNKRMPVPPTAKFIAVGPITRHAEDLRPTMAVLGGPDSDDVHSKTFAESSDKIERVYVLADPKINMTKRTTRELVDTTNQAASDLADALNVPLEPFPETAFRDAFDIYTAAISSTGGGTKLEYLLAGTSGMSLLGESMRTLLRRGHTAPALVTVVAERLLRPTSNQIATALRRIQELEQLLHRYLKNGVLVMPTFPYTAPKHNVTMRSPFDLAYTGIFNALRNPVSQVPCGFDGNGLPKGVQIASAMGNDNLTITAAETLASCGYRWVAPSI